MPVPIYEIFALKYAGPFTRPASIVYWFQDLDKSVQINYYVFAIRCGDETIIVDCGCSPGLAAERNLAGYVSPREVLKRIGIVAEEVKYLVATHIHFDHISGVELFPRATIYVQRKEFGFWIKDPIAKRAPFLHITDPVANSFWQDWRAKKGFTSSKGTKRSCLGSNCCSVRGTP